MSNNILLLGSKSASRKMLLNLAKIPYRVVEQNADETQCGLGLPFAQMVYAIALHKMNHIILPSAQENDISFVLTADTMVQDKEGVIYGKPSDYNNAVEMIKKARNGLSLATAFCLDKKVWKNGRWEVLKRISQVVEASYVLDIPNEWIRVYFQNSPGIECAGASSVEDFGAQFLKEIHGSYSAIIGLPLFEVRQGLESMGFFEELI